MVFPLATLPTEAHPIIWRATLAICVVANIIWYRVKFVLKAHGFPVSFIWHMSDVPNFHRLIRRETDGAQRSRFVWLLVTLYASGAAFVVLAVYLFTRP